MACKLRQIICIQEPVSSNNVCLKEQDGTCLDAEYSYSVNTVSWSDWSDKDTVSKYTLGLDSEYFLKLRVYGNPTYVSIDGKSVTFKTTLAPSFDMSSQGNISTYDPYSNLDCAMSLYQSLTDQVSNMIGIPCWYFKVSPDKLSKDLTFKEYCHLSVSSMKYIKIIIAEGQMPSSKPEMEEFGISFNTDWETEISKSVFATAFGITAQPQEGDLIYIPMMSRMWQVTSAYEEKKDGFMWKATTFQIYLRKYESQDAISTNEFESSIKSVIKNTYEDLFGDSTLGTNTDTLSAPVQALPLNNMYDIWQQDAYRKQINVAKLDIIEDSTYHKGLLVADNWYKGDINIVYQRKYCGSDGTIVFYIQDNGGSSEIISWGNNTISKKDHTLSFGDLKWNIDTGTWVIWLRWSYSLRRIECGSARLTVPKNIPLYRMRPSLYYFDFDGANKADMLYTQENIMEEKTDIIFKGNSADLFAGIKFYDSFEDIEMAIPQYPNSTHLLINDTVRNLIGTPGYPSNNI